MFPEQYLAIISDISIVSVVSPNFDLIVIFVFYCFLMFSLDSEIKRTLTVP